MTFLSSDSLEFAKAHLLAFYDSDFFPKPVEFDALWSRWSDVKKYLLKDPVKNQPVWAPRAFAAPKAGQGYRVVHQLHPLNAITYTALGYMVAEAVEAARSSADVACSYRIELLNGGFFVAAKWRRPLPLWLRPAGVASTAGPALGARVQAATPRWSCRRRARQRVRRLPGCSAGSGRSWWRPSSCFWPQWNIPRYFGPKIGQAVARLRLQHGGQVAYAL
jgi:hypothetical protein